MDENPEGFRVPDAERKFVCRDSMVTASMYG
jgi:hypothetical protein